MSGARSGRCPTCKQATTRETSGKLFPFCGERCWAIDLGRWLGEEYRVADSQDAPPAPDTSDDGGSGRR